MPGIRSLAFLVFSEPKTSLTDFQCTQNVRIHLGNVQRFRFIVKESIDTCTF
jgi:hypothetical protein